jgi:hypothetical protein
MHPVLPAANSESRRDGAISTRLLAWLVFGFASLALAEKITEPSDDFLTYLGELEDNDDNWSDFAQQQSSGEASSSNSHQASSTSSDHSSDQLRNRHNDHAAAERSHT